MEKIIDNLYNVITDTNTWDFVKTCDPDDYSERELQLIAWECGKRDLDCSFEEWHIAMERMKYIAIHGWDNYVMKYK